jgi:ubiquinone/menaquinone biosynthesis C-methylase UbiE
VAAPTTGRRRYYDATGDDYETSRYADRHMERYLAFRNSTLLSILNSKFTTQKLRILEVGCGTGLSLEFLGRVSPDYHLFGMDVSDTMVRQAAQKASALRNRPKLMLGDADRLPFREGLFDVVYATRFIHQFPHAAKQQLWREFRRATRKDGLIVMEFYARPYHWLRYYLGGAKGRSLEQYLGHFPSRRQVREIAAEPLEVHPLRLPGSRVIAGVLGDSLMHRLTRIVGRASRGLLVDEYFVVCRNR